VNKDEGEGNVELMVAVHGSYFVGNFGDTLLVRLMCDKIARELGPDKVFLAVPGNAEEQRNIGYKVVDAAKRSMVTHLIYAGGGYFGEPQGGFLAKLRWSFRNYRRHTSWIREFPNARIAVLGVGYGPLSYSGYKRSVARLVNQSAITVFRDVESIEFARRDRLTGYSETPCVDLALSLNKTQVQQSGVAIHVANLSSEEIRIVIDALLAHDPWENGIDVIFDQASSFGEGTCTKYRLSLGGHKVRLNFVPFSDYHALVNRLASYRLIVTSKLHVGVVGIALGVKVVSIPAHSKTSRLYRQLNLADFCVERRTLSRERLLDLFSVEKHFVPNRTVVDRGLQVLDDALFSFLTLR